MSLKILKPSKEHLDQIPGQVDQIIKMLDDEIEFHLTAIERIKIQKQDWQTFSETRHALMIPNQKLSREYLREFLRNSPNPIKTVTLIDALYKGKTEEERTLLIKRSSTILNQMVNEGELKKTTVPGEKGNYYEMIRKK